MRHPRSAFQMDQRVGELERQSGDRSRAAQGGPHRRDAPRLRPRVRDRRHRRMTEAGVPGRAQGARRGRVLGVRRLHRRARLQGVLAPVPQHLPRAGRMALLGDTGPGTARSRSSTASGCRASRSGAAAKGGVCCEAPRAPRRGKCGSSEATRGLARGRNTYKSPWKRPPQGGMPVGKGRDHELPEWARGAAS
jgi:hypothetical protein